MTKLTKSINKLTHDRHRDDSYDESYDDRHDRYDGHKPRYYDGHREERDKHYEDYGTYRKRYRSPCRQVSSKARNNHEHNLADVSMVKY